MLYFVYNNLGLIGLLIRKIISPLIRLAGYGGLAVLTWSEDMGLATLVVPLFAGLAPTYRFILAGALAWVLAFWLYHRGSWLGRHLRYAEENELARFLMAHADMGDDNGVVFLTADASILALSRLPLSLAYEHQPGVDPQGLWLQEAFAPRLSGFLQRLLQQARQTKQPAVADIVDWTLYSSVSRGAIRVMASPAYDDASYRGALLIFRNLAENKLLQQSLRQAQQSYQALFDGLTHAAAVFRPVPGPVPGTTDGLLLECNAPFRQLFAGLYEPPVTLVEFIRSHFVRVPQLRDAMAQLLTQGDRVRVEFFSDILGKYLDVNLAQLPGDRVLAITVDRTEQQLYAEQVLQLNDQLRLTVERQHARLAALTEERDRFIEAVADQVLASLDEAGSLSLPDPACAGTPMTQALRALAGQLVYYASVTSLPYAQSELIDTRQLLQRLVAQRQAARKDLAWALGELPALMGAPDVLANVLNRLFDVLESLPRLASVNTARITVSGWCEFLASGLSLAVVGLDARGLLVEVPETAQPLDWRLSGDLGLAIVRRMLVTHGGSLSLCAQADGFAIRFTLGTPD